MKLQSTTLFLTLLATTSKITASPVPLPDPTPHARYLPGRLQLESTQPQQSFHEPIISDALRPLDKEKRGFVGDETLDLESEKQRAIVEAILMKDKSKQKRERERERGEGKGKRYEIGEIRSHEKLSKDTTSLVWYRRDVEGAGGVGVEEGKKVGDGEEGDGAVNVERDVKGSTDEEEEKRILPRERQFAHRIDHRYHPSYNCWFIFIYCVPGQRSTPYEKR